MPSTCCCVPGCANRGGHEFPINIDRKKVWLNAIKRVENKQGTVWCPSASSAVCRAHFTEDDYQQTQSRGFRPGLRRLKQTAIPSQFYWTVESSSTAQSRTHRASERAAKKICIEASIVDPGERTLNNCVSEDEIIIGSSKEVESSIETHSEIGLQTDPPANMPDLGNQETQTFHSNGTTITDFCDKPSAVQFYTGLDNYELFCDVLASLGPAAFQLNYMHGIPSLTVENQLFMTLMKLRTYKTNFELSLMLKIGESEVYNVFITWVRFMALQWKEICIWPERDTVRFFAPSNFKNQFPKTRAIFDGTECPIQKPKAPRAQQVTYSTYKNKNTAKVLIGITPGGMVSYVFPKYAGSTSDRQIVERSRLTTMCDPGDTIMADKGFDVQDLFAPNNVTVNIPTFFRKKNRMSGKIVLKDREISSKRVHVERVIGLGKTYKLLRNPLNHTEMILSSDILFICYMLVNFRKCIVPKNA